MQCWGEKRGFFCFIISWFVDVVCFRQGFIWGKDVFLVEVNFSEVDRCELLSNYFLVVGRISFLVLEGLLVFQVRFFSDVNEEFFGDVVFQFDEVNFIIYRGKKFMNKSLRK